MYIQEEYTEEAIKKRMLEKATQKGINTGEGDFFNDAVSPAAIELTLAYQNLEHVLEIGFAETSYGEYLDKITSERGIFRKEATKGCGEIEVTARPDTRINPDIVFATKEGNIRFKPKGMNENGVVVGETGKVCIGVENETAGNLGDIPPNTEFIAPVAINGFTTAVNIDRINAGTDTEPDESLRERYLSTVRNPAVSGNKNDYIQWAENFHGVGKARVFPLWKGVGTVKVVIIDSNKQPASQELVDKLQKHIDPNPGCGEGKAPIGAVCTVVSAKGIPVNISAKINGADAELVKPLFEKALALYLASIAFHEKSVSVSSARVSSILLDCISQVKGEYHTEFKINGGDSNITPKEDEVAVVGVVTLS